MLSTSYLVKVQTFSTNPQSVSKVQKLNKPCIALFLFDFGLVVRRNENSRFKFYEFNHSVLASTRSITYEKELSLALEPINSGR